MVSPGCVGCVVVGTLEGREVGAEEVGMDVGAFTTTDCPITTLGVRIALIE